MDNTVRYRMGNPGMLPKFGSHRNPFRAGAKRQEPMQLVVADDVEPERAVPAGVDDQVDGMADLDAVRAHGQAKQMAGKDPGHS